MLLSFFPNHAYQDFPGIPPKGACSRRLTLFLILSLIFLNLNFVSAAHYIVGIANDAYDGTSVNDFEVVLWNPANGISDNLTDVVGVNGNSGVSNFYLIDCEGLDTPCAIGDNLNMTIFSYPYSKNASVIVTGAGFDLAENITLNSRPSFESIIVDDSYEFPIFSANEIDLFANSTRDVFCWAVIDDFDSDGLRNISSEFFDNSASFFGDDDDNNYHYSNNSCFVNSSYAGNQVLVNCSFEVLYNANYGEWNCSIYAEDNMSTEKTGSDTTTVNQLLALGVWDYLDFGDSEGDKVTDEGILNITNMGNVQVNLSLSGYGASEGDGYAMICSSGNIPIEYKKYNLTSSTSGNLSLSEFEATYINLTSSPVTKEFNLNYRMDEFSNEAINSTYWRVYVPSSIGGTCSGNIVIGAVAAGE